MNATNVKGVWSQDISDKTAVIVDTNRFQIIKRTNGVAVSTRNYPSEPTVSMIEITIKVMTITERMVDSLEIMKAKLKLRNEKN